MIGRTFRRLFWLTLGVVLGIFLWRKLTKVAHSYTPEGLTERAKSGAEQAGSQWRSFVGDVRQLSASKEAELRRELDANRPAREPNHRGLRRGDGR